MSKENNYLSKVSLNHDFIQVNIENENDLSSLFAEAKDHDLVLRSHEVNSENKTMFMTLLALYLFGGLALNDKIILKDIDAIQNLYDKNEMVVVKSCLNDELFTGFICSRKHNNILRSVLECYLENILIDKSLTIKGLLYSYSSDNLILNERIIDNVSFVYNSNGIEVIAEHHFTKLFPLQLNEIGSKTKDNCELDLSKLKIGITIDVPETLSSFYSNGIRQNALYLYELLYNIGYDVKLITSNNKPISNVLDSIEFFRYTYTKLDSIFCEKFNLIFSFGFSLPKALLTVLKALHVKVIAYFCGNSYLIDSERILYNQHKDKPIGYQRAESNMYDQIWSIPQMYKQNKYYWETIYRSQCIQVPFIWSPSSIEFVKIILQIESEKELMYKKKNNKIAVFEPNISLMKWCMPCVMITEMAHRKYQNVEHVYVTNMELNKNPEEMKINNFNNTEFSNFCKCLDLFESKKLTAEKRYITLEFMSKFADIAVSHQWENPLNYLYFDLAWMGWPVLHNAYLCKDVGYYYSEFNYEEGCEKLNEILLHHDANKNEYLKHNRDVIQNYIPTNTALQQKYKALIEHLFA